MLNFFISNALETVPIFTFFLENSSMNFLHILWNHPRQPLHSAICLSTTLLFDFFHGIRQLQYNITFIIFSKHFLIACSVLGNSLTLSSSKQWSKWDLTWRRLVIYAAIKQKKWMLLQRCCNHLHFTVVEPAKQ